MTEDDRLKYRLIYRRFLVIFFSFLTIYSFLHWLLVLRLHSIDIRENLGIWLPMFLPIIPLWICLGKRIRLLQLMKDGKSELPGFLLMGHLAIACTTVAFQYYLVSAAGELRALKTPEEITRYEPVKYYTIESCYADKAHAKFRRFQHLSGKRNRTLNYELVIAVPLYSKAKEDVLKSAVNAGDTSVTTEAYATAIQPGEPDPAVWICLHYKTELSNKSTLSQKENAWEQFEWQCEEDLKNTNLNNFTYLHSPGKGDYRDQLMEAVKGPYVLEPRYEPFQERTYAQIGWTLLIFIVGAGIWWMMVHYKSFDTAALDKFTDQQNT